MRNFQSTTARPHYLLLLLQVLLQRKTTIIIKDQSIVSSQTITFPTQLYHMRSEMESSSSTTPPSEEVRGPQPQPTDGSVSTSRKRPLEESTNSDSLSNKQQIIQGPETSDGAEIKVAPLPANNVVDITQIVQLEPGARIEVQWDITLEGEQDDKPQSTELHTHRLTRWWGGTLLPKDSRTHSLEDHDGQVQDEVTVPVRVIDYDPYFDGGFPDRSLEDVCFLSDHSLLNVSSNSRAFWRKEGDNWEPPLNMDEDDMLLMSSATTTTITGLPAGIASSANGNTSDDGDDVSVASASKDDAMKLVLDSVLQSAMQTSGILEKLNTLDPSQQRFMAEKIAFAKEKLAEKLAESLEADNGRVVVTKEHVIKSVEEFRKEE